MNSFSLLRMVQSVLLILLCNLARVSAQTSSTALPRTIGRDLKHVVQSAGHVLASPLRWRGKEWTRFGFVVGGSIVLSLGDEQLNEVLKRNHSRAADKFAQIGAQYGEPRTVVILTGGVYAVGLLAQNEWLRESAVILTGALLPAGLMQTAAKITAGRARPHLGLGHDAFEPFRREEAYYSFVSGHTMVAMATSHVFAKRLDNLAAKAGLYGLGALTGMSRLYHEDHWFSDVVLGGALAIMSVNSAAKFVEKRNRAEMKTGLHWRAQPHARGIAITLLW